MDSTVEIRPGVAGDVDAMYALDVICFAEAFRFELELIRRLACSPKAIVTVAESGGTVVGFVIANLWRRRGAATAYILTLDVAPLCRRGGLGRRLMEDAEIRCAGAGAAWVSLHVWTENSTAISFYEGLGYKRRGRVPGYYGEAGDAWVYGKSLAL